MTGSGVQGPLRAGTAGGQDIEPARLTGPGAGLATGGSLEPRKPSGKPGVPVPFRLTIAGAEQSQSATNSFFYLPRRTRSLRRAWRAPPSFSTEKALSPPFLLYKLIELALLPVPGKPRQALVGLGGVQPEHQPPAKQGIKEPWPTRRTQVDCEQDQVYDREQTEVAIKVSKRTDPSPRPSLELLLTRRLPYRNARVQTFGLAGLTTYLPPFHHLVSPAVTIVYCCPARKNCTTDNDSLFSACLPSSIASDGGGL